MFLANLSNIFLNLNMTDIEQDIKYLNPLTKDINIENQGLDLNQKSQQK